MKVYLLALAVGLLVGLIYGLLNVRSPAPPVIALVGLLGILLGEQIPPLLKHYLHPQAKSGAWIEDQVRPHMFGQLPQCTTIRPGQAASDTPPPSS
jgi:XapX domain-containing protein